MIGLIIFGLILLFLWGLVELSKTDDREEHNRIMEEKESYVDNRKVIVNIDEYESGNNSHTLKKINR